MGLNYYVAREVLRAREESGVERVATLGQLQQFLLRKQCRALQREFALPDVGGWTHQRFGDFGDGFLHAAGVRDLVVVDASDYEGAGVVHDLNEPIGEELEQQFDQVIDGGTIEHVFRPDQALANMMRMAKVGGSIIVATTANNLCGHGFYQFSPEFFFSALTEETGFDIHTALLVEAVYPSISLVPPRGAYRVRSPQDVHRRVGVMSRRPLVMLVRAVKTAHLADPFARTPQQSDYVDRWTEDADGEANGNRAAVPAREPMLRSVARGAYHRARSSTVAGPIARRAIGLRERRQFSLANRRFFEPE